MNIATTSASPALHLEGPNQRRDLCDDGPLIEAIRINLTSQKASLAAEQEKAQSVCSLRGIFNKIFCVWGKFLILTSFVSLYLSATTLFNAAFQILGMYFGLVSGVINTLYGTTYVVQGMRALNTNRKMEGCYKCFAGCLLLCLGMLTIAKSLCTQNAATSVTAIAALMHPTVLLLLCTMFALCLIGEMVHQCYHMYRKDRLGDLLMQDLKIISPSQQYAHILNRCLSAVLEESPTGRLPLRTLRQQLKNGRQGEVEISTTLSAMVKRIKENVSAQAAIETCQLLIDLSPSPPNLKITQKGEGNQSQESDPQGQEVVAAWTRIKAQQDALLTALNTWQIAQCILAAQYVFCIFAVALTCAAFYVSPDTAYIFNILSKCCSACSLMMTSSTQ